MITVAYTTLTTSHGFWLIRTLSAQRHPNPNSSSDFIWCWLALIERVGRFYALLSWRLCFMVRFLIILDILVFKEWSIGTHWGWTKASAPWPCSQQGAGLLLWWVLNRDCLLRCIHLWAKQWLVPTCEGTRQRWLAYRWHLLALALRVVDTHLE